MYNSPTMVRIEIEKGLLLMDMMNLIPTEQREKFEGFIKEVWDEGLFQERFKHIQGTLDAN
jgi:hypothetical protein